MPGTETANVRGTAGYLSVPTAQTALGPHLSAVSECEAYLILCLKLCSLLI